MQSLIERLPKKVVEIQKIYDLVTLLGINPKKQKEIQAKLLDMEHLLDDAYNELKEKQNG